MDEVLTRLTLLEALVSRLTARGEQGTASGGLRRSEENLQEAYAQVTRERNQLQLDQERLNAQVWKLQGTVAELNRETERLRQRPCEQTHTSGGTLHENRPVGGMLLLELETYGNVFVVTMKIPGFQVSGFVRKQF